MNTPVFKILTIFFSFAQLMSNKTLHLLDTFAYLIVMCIIRMST